MSSIPAIARTTTITVVFLFFFSSRRRNTRCLSDWSSDVCSSDLVNTHWHYDHLDGNSVFGSDVQIIGHDYVRYALLNLDVLPKEIDRHLEEMPGQMETLKKQIGREKDPKRRAVLEKQRAAIQAALEELKVMKPS